MMSTQFNFEAISQSLSLQGCKRVVNNASDSDTQPSTDHHILPPARGPPSDDPRPTHPPTNDDPPRRAMRRFTPFDEHLNELVDTPQWQKDFDDHFARVFRRFLSDRLPIDDPAAQALEMVGTLTQPKVRGLALAVYTHWVRMQCYCDDANAFALEIVALIWRVSRRLGCISAHAQKDFLDALDHLCIGKLKLTCRWYLAVAIRGILPIPLQELFMQVMTIGTMIGHLFHGGLLQHGAALDGLRHIATTLPWPDAIAIIYALLRKLGPDFAMESTGLQFIQYLLAQTLPLTVGRAPVEPVCQLVFAINTLLAEWHNRTRVTLYHTYPRRNDRFDARHSQTWMVSSYM